MTYQKGDRVKCVAPDCTCGGLVGTVDEVDENDGVLPYFVLFTTAEGVPDDGWMMAEWLEAAE